MEDYWKEIEELNNQLSTLMNMARESDDNEVQEKLIGMHFEVMKRKKQLMTEAGRNVRAGMRSRA